ncbi:hypothetical protein Holit_01499 [Hollandina sp. SP2]
MYGQPQHPSKIFYAFILIIAWILLHNLATLAIFYPHNGSVIFFFIKLSEKNLKKIEQHR